MEEKRISICDLCGMVDEWANKGTAPTAKVKTKDSKVVEGQILVGKNAPEWVRKARPTEIWINGECEISLTSIKSLEIDDVLYVVKDNNKG